MKSDNKAAAGLPTSAGTVPKYEQIIQDLLRHIRNGDFSYSVPLCTERQLSLDYQVSRITSKRAITELEQRGILYRRRGAGSFVCPEAGTTPPSAGEETRTVAFLLPFDITKGGLPDTVEVINSLFSAHEYFMAIYVSNKNYAKERNALKILLNQNISGLIYYPLRDRIYLDLLNSFILSGKPVVILDKSTNCPYLSNIISDNVEGGRLLAEHLIGLGHKNIAFLSNASIEDTSSVRDRFGGMIAQLKASKLFLNPDYVAGPFGDLNEANASCEHGNARLNEAVKKLYQAGATAIIAENDEIAYYTLISCHELGIRVPEDLSVCGFDNNEWSKLWPSRITTVSQDFNALGEYAAGIILKSIDIPNTPPVKHIVPVSLVTGGTTGKCPQNNV